MVVFNSPNEGRFRFWCQKVLPLIYDDSLSYYELLAKVVVYLNNVIEDIGKIPDYVAEEISKVVNTYVDTADELITLSPDSGSFISTRGFHSIGDKGGCMYRITTNYNDIVNEPFYLTLTGENRWAIPIILTPYVTPEMFGAYGDGIHDDTIAVNQALKYKDVNIVNVYNITDSLIMIESGKIHGEGTLKRNANGFPLIIANNNCDISVNLIGYGDVTEIADDNDREILARSVKNVKIHDCKIKGTTYEAIVIWDSIDCSVTDNEITDYGYCGILNYGNSVNTLIHNNHVVNGLYIATSNRYAIIASTGSENGTDVPKNTICTNNFIKDTTPLWEGIDAHEAQGLIISDNIIINTLRGIAIVNRDGVSINSYGIIITNNYYYCDYDVALNSNSEGIILAANASDSLIANNTLIIKGTNSAVVSNAKPCIAIRKSGTTVLNNHITSTDDTRPAILVQANAAYGNIYDYKVNDNIIDVPYIGLSIKNGSGMICNGKAEGNSFYNCSVGVDGNTQYGPSGQKYLNRNYIAHSRFVNVATKIDNNIFGTFLDFGTSDANAQGSGAYGDIIYNAYFGTGSKAKYAYWICTADATESSPATWLGIDVTYS